MFRSRPLNLLVATITLFFLSIIVFFIDAKFIEPEKIVITKNTHNLTTSASEPIHLVLISDVHAVSEKSGDLDEKVALINQQNPDIILIAGDFINSDISEVSKLRPLRNLRAKYGVYAVLGNHDYNVWSPEIRHTSPDQTLAQSVSDELESDGVNVLRNEFEKINVNGKKFELYGSDDQWSGRSSYIESNLSLPKIILVHERIAINESKISQKTLILSGHTHCGEVRIPLVTEYIMSKILSGFGDVVGGWSKRNDHVDDYVTCGLTRGTSGFRLFTNPEISVIDIY